MKRHGPLVAGCAALIVSWLLLGHVGFWVRGQQSDTGFYQAYGTRVLDGEVPYRDFALEYPPAALPVFVLPALGRPKAEPTYRHRFEWLMALCGVFALAGVDAALRTLRASAEARLATMLLIGVSPLVLGPVILTRFDLWPAALSIASLAAFLRGRSRLGAGVLGLATAAKLYPVVIAPVALAHVWRREGPRAAAWSAAVFAGVFAACVLPFAVLGPHGLLESFTGQFERPLEIESLGAAFLIAAHHLAGLKLGVEVSHTSLALGGTSGTVVAAATTALEIAALCWVWVACARRRGAERQLVVGAAAAVAIFIAFGKVFSPQYLIWLLPLVPLVQGRLRVPAVCLLVAALGLTQTWIPRRFDALVRFQQPESWLLLARDLVVVALALLLASALRAKDETPRAQTG
jgi:hypothetical protein